MARLGSAAKARRLLEFLLGLRDDRVLELLEARGFGAQERVKGWELLQALGMTQAVVVPKPTSVDAASALDAWRSEWMRLVQVSLAQSHSAIQSQLFRGLDAKRMNAMTRVSVFLSRFEKLTNARDATSRAAVAKLRSRGFSPERQAEAHRLLHALMHAPLPSLPDPDVRRAAIHAAESALWEYYLEWSRLARAVIQDERLLMRLGYRNGAGPDDEESDAAPPTRRPATKPRKPGKASKKRIE